MLDPKVLRNPDGTQMLYNRGKAEFLILIGETTDTSWVGFSAKPTNNIFKDLFNQNHWVEISFVELAQFYLDNLEEEVSTEDKTRTIGVVSEEMVPTMYIEKELRPRGICLPVDPNDPAFDPGAFYKTNMEDLIIQLKDVIMAFESTKDFSN